MKPSTRRVVTRAPARTVRVINLPGLLPVPVEAESSLEGDFIPRAALAPLVCMKVVHQPFKLPVTPRGYTPDFLITSEEPNEKDVSEVKLEKKLSAYSDVFDSAAEYLLGKGYIFYVVTEKHLHKNRIHDRVDQIRRYLKAVFPVNERQRVSDLLTEHPQGMPIGTLMRKAKVSYELILHMMAMKVVTTGPNLHTDKSACVRLTAVVCKERCFNLGVWLGVRPWGSEE